MSDETQKPDSEPDQEHAPEQVMVEEDSILEHSRHWISTPPPINADREIEVVTVNGE